MVQRHHRQSAVVRSSDSRGDGFAVHTCVNNARTRVAHLLKLAKNAAISQELRYRDEHERRRKMRERGRERDGWREGGREREGEREREREREGRTNVSHQM